MDQTAETGAAGTNEAGLCLVLEHLLRKAEAPVTVCGLRRRPSPFASLFPAEILSVVLRGGEEVSLFVKHLGPEQADHPDKQCRDREKRVYEELLAEDALPAPRYFGSRQNEATGRLELFLEYVADWDLRYQGLEHWFTAARRLARLHAHFAGRAEKPLACDFLLRLDARYLHDWAVRALAAVREMSADLSAALAPVVDRYGRVCEVLARQPLTLVHNDLAPKNVLADRSRDPAGIYLVDWEMAGVGCGLMDLVHLKYGLDPANDALMCSAYCTELAGTGLLPRDPRELSRLFAACEIHQTISRLAFSKAWRLPVARVAQWVAEARCWMEKV